MFIRSHTARLRAILVAALVTVGCADQITSSTLHAKKNLKSIEFSEGFYEDPNDPGHFFWDGYAPPGDQSPAIISDAWTESVAPGPDNSGEVRGIVNYTGDQGRVDVNYSLSYDGNYVYQNATTSSTFTWDRGMTGLMGALFNLRDVPTSHRHERFLNVNNACAPGSHSRYTLSAGGTGYARKTWPFGIPYNLLKPKSAGLDLSGISWGLQDAPLRASTAVGDMCNPCDNPNTDDIEECSDDNPPPSDAEGPPNYEWGGSEDVPVDDEYWIIRCWYKDRWYGDYYLGRFWLYCERIG